MPDPCKFKVGDIVIAGSNTPYRIFGVRWKQHCQVCVLGWAISVETVGGDRLPYEDYPEGMFRLAVPEQIRELVLKGVLDDS